MNRHQRHSARRAISLDTKERELLRAFAVAVTSQVPAPDREPFLKALASSLYQTFKTERMDKRLIIENKIRSLNLRFPNGTAGKEYAHRFALPSEDISNVTLEGAEELGLTLAVEPDGTFLLSGTPGEAGDYTLILRYDTLPGEPSSELPIPVAFNPDPRKLWRNIPSSPSLIFHKPDCEKDFVKVTSRDGSPRKDMVAASQRGRSHAQEGNPRDDHYALHHCSDSDWYIMAVGDGAGSAKYSRKGAEVACQNALEFCRKSLEDNPAFDQAVCDYQADPDNAAKRQALTKHVMDVVLGAAKNALEGIKKIVADNRESQMTLRDFSTTLMLAICKRFDFGWFIASFWVGDGAMAIYDEEHGIVKLLGTPDEGEYSGQTRFLTMPEIFQDPDVVQKRLKMGIVPDFTALFLMTDGVSDPMFETDNNLQSFEKWREFHAALRGGFPKDGIKGVDLTDDNEEAADQLLGWLDFWSPGNHDDRTIAILY